MLCLNKSFALSHSFRQVFSEGKREAGELRCRSTDSWAYLPHTSGEPAGNNRKNGVVSFFLKCLQHNFTILYLQDFYSHSNWVELGNKAPYSALIQPERSLENLAGRNLVTAPLE